MNPGGPSDALSADAALAESGVIDDAKTFVVSSFLLLLLCLPVPPPNPQSHPGCNMFRVALWIVQILDQSYVSA
jgi:hypothetical protein